MSVLFTLALQTPSMVILIQSMILLSCFLFISEQLRADGCFDRCGEMKIPYPFSIGGLKGKKCGLPGFEINCKQNESFGTIEPIPFILIPSGEVQILNFSHDHLVINSTQFLASTSNCLGHTNITQITISDQGPFQFSSQNKFVVVGCETLGMFGKFDDGAYTSLGGCLSVCSDSPTFSSCNGDGCCQTSVPPDYMDYLISVTNLSLSQSNYEIACNYAGLIDQSSWNLISQSNAPNLNYAQAYISLNWSIPNETCASAKEKGSYQCFEDAECNDLGWGYLCNCRPGFHGDGYFNGSRCTDIDECSDPSLNDCYPSSKGGRCINIKGSYKCSCGKGHGDGTEDGTRCSTTMFQTLPFAIGVCVTLVGVLIGGAIVLLLLKRRTARLVKQYNFRRNGGTHLQKLISSKADGLRIFSLDEVEKATQNFSQNLIFGCGGYATVYKGTLSDGFIVAIKKAISKQVDSKEIKDFINEIVILNQINHRNVVKLLGCCLETPVPLLVYEYISNGTLFDHLYGDKYEHRLHWETRLRIATETAEALSYLHSAASTPMVHRDVKSSNILLDSDYNPKVTDFGLSRLVPKDQTHITTLVQGTLGYLDPEYFQTVQLTEKSDVYSFGVVLVELLTGLKAVSFERTKNQSNLAIYFLNTMKTKDLAEILDCRLTVEEGGNKESMAKVANLAKSCLSVEGEKRPTMKEVVQQLLLMKTGGRGNVVPDSDVA